MRVPVWCVAALLVGCPGVIENPTGDCRADGDGGRTCVHAPGRGDTWLPDCRAPLDREYWRVFARSSTSAYVFPRPDGAGLARGICDGDDAELAGVFVRAGLCVEPPNLSIINDLAPADALAVTHALHERLDFEAVDLGGGVWAVEPTAFDDDVAAACEGPAQGVAALAEACDFYVERVRTEQCTDIAYVLGSEEAARALADALDALYGVGG